MFRIIRICRNKFSWHRWNRWRNYSIRLERTRTKWGQRKWGRRIFGYFEEGEALQEDEPNQNDFRLTHPIGFYRNMGQIDQKPAHLSLRLTEIPLPPWADKDKGLKWYVLPEPKLEVDLPLGRVKQEEQETSQEERPFKNEKLTADGALKIVEHDSFVSFRGSSIPLSTDFAETVLPLISNQLGLALSRFRNVDQEQTMRTLVTKMRSR